MRKRSSALVALVVAGAFAGSAAAQDVQTLKIACVLDAQHPLMVGGRRMAEVVERESKGRLKIALYPSSQLGGQREVLQNVQAGVVDGVLEATATLTNFVPQFGAIDLPYLAKDQDTAYRLFDSPVFEQELVAAGSRRGLSRGARLGGHVPQRLHAREGDQQRRPT